MAEHKRAHSPGDLGKYRSRRARTTRARSGQRILQHHLKYLPKTTAELERRGTLHQVISGLADRTEEQLNDLHNQGVADDAVWETVNGQAFPPEETAT